MKRHHGLTASGVALGLRRGHRTGRGRKRVVFGAVPKDDGSSRGGEAPGGTSSPWKNHEQSHTGQRSQHQTEKTALSSLHRGSPPGQESDLLRAQCREAGAGGLCRLQRAGRTGRGDGSPARQAWEGERAYQPVWPWRARGTSRRLHLRSLLAAERPGDHSLAELLSGGGRGGAGRWALQRPGQAGQVQPPTVMNSICSSSLRSRLECKPPFC